jgi:hypothetical protein
MIEVELNRVHCAICDETGGGLTPTLGPCNACPEHLVAVIDELVGKVEPCRVPSEVRRDAA